MSVAQSVATILRDHVTLEIENFDSIVPCTRSRSTARSAEVGRPSYRIGASNTMSAFSSVAGPGTEL
jgi:hypothetical protein